MFYLVLITSNDWLNPQYSYPLTDDMVKGFQFAKLSLVKCQIFTEFVIDSSFAEYRELTSTAYWFTRKSNLTSITGMEYLHTENVTDMTGMFAYCSKLTSINLSHFCTDNVIYTVQKAGMDGSVVYGLFTGCSSLKSLDLSGFDTKNVTDMSGLFNGCSGLTSIDLSCINTENVEDMSRMFRNCSGFTSLDLSSFNTDKVEYVSYMFYNCSNLTTIYVSDIWNKNGFCKDNQLLVSDKKLS